MATHDGDKQPDDNLTLEDKYAEVMRLLTLQPIRPP